MKIDLHCHSTNSDGKDTVKQILHQAEKLEIKGLCISDHDNFKGSEEAFDINNGIYSGKLIPGIEISTKIKGKTVHLLAYFPTFKLDQKHELFVNLEKIRTDRIRRMKRMTQLATEAGKKITFEDVLQEAQGESGKEPIDVISRPHFARAFIRLGYANTMDEVFDNYIGEGKPFHAERFSLKYYEWITLVHEIGGLIFWAHPLHGHDNNYESLEEIANILKELIDGIEFYYNYKGKYIVDESFVVKGTQFLDKIILEKNLLKTAGGDYHGDVGKLGAVDLPKSDWLNFKKRLFK